MKTKRIVGVVIGVLCAAAAIACSSSSSSSGGTATLGSACQADTDCAPSSRGEVACFIGGQGSGTGDGGGMGDGGGPGDGGGGAGGDGGGANAGKTWCALKCTPDNAAQLCGAPFDGICNPRGYCRLN